MSGSCGAGTYNLTVTAPADDLGPEVYYLLFVLEFHTAANRSVPSVAKFVRFVAP